MAENKSIIILHETGGRKYFEAIDSLGINGIVDGVKYFETSILKNFLRSLYKNKFSYGLVQIALKNIAFRFSILRISNQIIVMGIAPWDYRMIIYAILSRSNRLIYHTSWPYWTKGPIPRRYWLFTNIMKYIWIKILSSMNIEIVAVSELVANEVKLVLHENCIKVIPHVVSNSFYKKKSKFSNKEFRLIFVGNLIPEKGVLLLIDLWKTLNNGKIRLDIVGSGLLRDRLMRELNHDARVTIHGQIHDRDQLAHLLGQSHVLLVPSCRTKTWEELFGMVIIEAMAAGVPSVATDHVGPRSIIEHGVSGFIAPENSILYFYEKIILLMENKDIWEKMSREANLKAKKYSMKYIAKDWMNFLGVK